MLNAARLLPRLRPPRRRDEVRISYASDDQPPARRAIIRAVEILGGQRRLAKLYDQYRASGPEQGSFFEAAVRLMRLGLEVDEAALEAIPATGPVVFVSNHPFGVVDGLVFTYLASRVRPDVKVLTHAALCRVPESMGNLLPIDFSDTAEGRMRTVTTRAAAIDWLKAGHAIGIFPGGGVATSSQPLKGPAIEFAWHPFTAKLVRGGRASVVPIYFGGQNSRLFQVASHVSYTLRLALLFYESARRLGSRVEAAVGRPIPYAELEAFGSRTDLVAELKRRTFALAADLGHRDIPDPEREFRFPRHIRFN